MCQGEVSDPAGVFPFEQQLKLCQVAEKTGTRTVTHVTQVTEAGATGGVLIGYADVTVLSHILI